MVLASLDFRASDVIRMGEAIFSKPHHKTNTCIWYCPPHLREGDYIFTPTKLTLQDGTVQYDVRTRGCKKVKLLTTIIVRASVILLG